MKLPTTILVPTDFSAAAEAALDTALQLAARLGASVHVLHTYQLPIVGFPDGMPMAEIASRIITSAKQELETWVAKRRDSPVPLVPMLEQGDPREKILSVARDISADLVVMGTHGRHGIVRALIGSVAEAIIRSSPIPVMTVHAAPSGVQGSERENPGR